MAKKENNAPAEQKTTRRAHPEGAVRKPKGMGKATWANLARFLTKGAQAQNDPDYRPDLITVVGNDKRRWKTLANPGPIE